MENDMVEHHLKGPSMAERIAARGKNSGEGAKPDTIVKTGDSDRRTFHNIHNAGHYVDPSTKAKPTDGHVDVHPGSTSQGSGGNP
jgi:hypothetical protein